MYKELEKKFKLYEMDKITKNRAAHSTHIGAMHNLILKNRLKLIRVYVRRSRRRRCRTQCADPGSSNCTCMSLWLAYI